MKIKSTLPITYLGLIIAFFGIPLIVFISSLFAPWQYFDFFLIKKEAAIFVLTGLLLLLITKGEKKGLDSIGLHNKHWFKSIKNGILLALVIIIVLLLCSWVLSLFGIEVGGNEAKRYQSISIWTIVLMTVRAGIVEEICYRGYIIERLEKISNGNIWVFLIMPVIIFAFAHYSQGVAGIVISFFAALILAYVYWKKRDLKANIIAHFLVDFIPNVLFLLLPS